jgi:hypothetical protein
MRNSEDVQLLFATGAINQENLAAAGYVFRNQVVERKRAP